MSQLLISAACFEINVSLVVIDISQSGDDV